MVYAINVEWLPLPLRVWVPSVSHRLLLSPGEWICVLAFASWYRSPTHLCVEHVCLSVSVCLVIVPIYLLPLGDMALSYTSLSVY